MERSEQEKRDMRLRRRRLAKRRRLVFLCLFCVILAITAFTVISNAQVIKDQQAQITDLQAQIAAAQARNEQMRLQLAYMRTDEYYRSVAREQLGLMLPGEIRFVQKPASGGN